MSLRPSRLVWVYDKHSLDLWILKIVLLEGIHPTSSCPPIRTTNPLLPSLPYTCNLSYYSSCEKVVQNPAVLATYVATRDGYKTLAKRPL